MTKKTNNYKDSGVNVQEGQDFIDDIKDELNDLQNNFAIGSIGGFSGYIDPPKNYKDPVYALACDGVGTKLRIASSLENYQSIGIDLVAMCVNDLIVSGAKPIAFLDYYGVSKLDRQIGRQVISGILKGCQLSGCDLIGGETAEMPNHYTNGNFDLVGFAMGINERNKIIDGSGVKDGDCILAIPSSGFHSNGFSLLNKILEGCQADKIDLLQELLTPTRIYVSEILGLNKNFTINSMAHITGGGLEENLTRAVPHPLSVVIQRDAWEMPKLFKKIQKLGNISSNEMLKVFNCGVGFCLIADKDVSDQIIAESEEIIQIGNIQKNMNERFLIK